jgi:hypothetical protein
VTPETPDPQNLRTEYTVLGSYISAMTGMRFQTVTIFLAAIGLIASSGNQSPRTGGLILVVSIGLWVLDLRNRDVLRRLGERGSQIEKHEWLNKTHARRYNDEEAHDLRFGFFLDHDAPARIRFLIWGPWTPPERLSRFVRHAVGIDLVFVGAAGYAIALLV